MSRRTTVTADPLQLALYLVGGVFYGSVMRVEFGTLGVLITAALYAPLVLWILRHGEEA